jgi:hypothetical protein
MQNILQDALQQVLNEGRKIVIPIAVIRDITQDILSYVPIKQNVQTSARENPVQFVEAVYRGISPHINNNNIHKEDLARNIGTFVISGGKTSNSNDRIHSGIQYNSLFHNAFIGPTQNYPHGSVSFSFSSSTTYEARRRASEHAAKLVNEIKNVVLPKIRIMRKMAETIKKIQSLGSDVQSNPSLSHEQNLENFLYQLYLIEENNKRQQYNSEGFNFEGYDREGYNRAGFNAEGFNREGFNSEGFNAEGFNREGFNSEGFNAEGFNSKGFNAEGFNSKGFNREGFNREGVDAAGFNREGFNAEGFNRAGFNREGFNRAGFNREGFNAEGFNRAGFNREGFNSEGYDRNEFDRNGIHKKTGTLFNAEGYNREGYDREGFNRAGFNREGFNRAQFKRARFKIEGYDREGYNREGYNREGYNREGYNREGYNREGYDREGYNRNEFDRNGIHKKTGTLYDTHGRDVFGNYPQSHESEATRSAQDPLARTKEFLDKNGMKYKVKNGQIFITNPQKEVEEFIKRNNIEITIDKNGNNILRLNPRNIIEVSVLDQDANLESENERVAREGRAGQASALENQEEQESVPFEEGHTPPENTGSQQTVDEIERELQSETPYNNPLVYYRNYNRERVERYNQQHPDNPIISNEDYQRLNEEDPDGAAEIRRLFNSLNADQQEAVSYDREYFNGLKTASLENNVPRFQLTNIKLEHQPEQPEQPGSEGILEEGVKKEIQEILKKAKSLESSEWMKDPKLKQFFDDMVSRLEQQLYNDQMNPAQPGQERIPGIWNIGVEGRYNVNDRISLKGGLESEIKEEGAGSKLSGGSFGAEYKFGGPKGRGSKLTGIPNYQPNPHVSNAPYTSNKLNLDPFTLEQQSQYDKPFQHDLFEHYKRQQSEPIKELKLNEEDPPIYIRQEDGKEFSFPNYYRGRHPFGEAYEEWLIDEYEQRRNAHVPPPNWSPPPRPTPIVTRTPRTAGWTGNSTGNSTESSTGSSTTGTQGQPLGNTPYTRKIDRTLLDERLRQLALLKKMINEKRKVGNFLYSYRPQFQSRNINNDIMLNQIYHQINQRNLNIGNFL